MFSEYVGQILYPALRPNDIVIMDNLSAHKNREVAEHIKKRGAELLYLPAYSPDLNPIENMWSKVKQLLRGMATRTYEALEKGIAEKKAPGLKGGFVSFGSGLLSHKRICSIIGDEELNCRVRNGVGCTLFSMAAKIPRYIIDREEGFF